MIKNLNNILFALSTCTVMSLVSTPAFSVDGPYTKCITLLANDIADIAKSITVPNASSAAKKPEKLDEMLSIAERLSKDMYYARVDLYYVNGKIYFGEITLYPTGGFSTFTRHKDDLLLGSYIKLPTDD